MIHKTFTIDKVGTTTRPPYILPVLQIFRPRPTPHHPQKHRSPSRSPGITHIALQILYTDSFQGRSSSSISGFVRNSMLGSTVSNSSKYLNTSSLFALAVSTMLYITALALAPLGVSLKSRFFLPTVKGLIAFSAMLLNAKSDLDVLAVM